MFVGIVAVFAYVIAASWCKQRNSELAIGFVDVAVVGYVLECARRVTFGVVVLAFRRGRKNPSASPGSHFLS